MESLKALVRTIPDFPKPGIQFRDITTLLKSPEGLRDSVEALCERYSSEQIDYIAGIEARGFILGAALALQLGKGFIPIRKPNKLPGTTHRVSYELEYGSDSLEIHADAIHADAKVLLVDDLLATGGTFAGGCRLVEQAGGIVVGCACVIELPELDGRKALEGHDVFSIISFSGE